MRRRRKRLHQYLDSWHSQRCRIASVSLQSRTSDLRFCLHGSQLHLGEHSFLYVEVISTRTASFSASDLLLCCLWVCAHSCHLFSPLFVCKGPINSELYPCSVSVSDTSNGCKRCCQMRRGHSCMQLLAGCAHPAWFVLPGRTQKKKSSKRTRRIFSSGEPNECQQVCL